MELTATIKAKNITLEYGLNCLVWLNDVGKHTLTIHWWEVRVNQVAVFLPLLEKDYKLIAINAHVARSHSGNFVDAIETAQSQFG